MSIVSSIVTLETQKNPGIVPSRILASKAFLGPYILLAKLEYNPEGKQGKSYGN